MKNILILTNSEHAYQGSGGRTRIISEIAVLKPLDLNIRILCIIPLRKFLKRAYIKKAASNLSQDSGVIVTVVPSIPTSHFVPMARLSHVLNALFLYIYSKWFTTDAIHAHGNVIALSALLLKKLNRRIRVITDAHGCVSAEYKYEVGDFDKHWVKWLDEIEKKVIQKSDEIIFVSKRMKEYYQNLYQTEIEHARVINCACQDYQKISLSARKYKRRELELDDRIVFVYLGSYRKYQMAEETIQLFAQIKQHISEAHFLILTSHGSLFSNALHKAGILKSDFTIIGVPQEEVRNYLCTADFGFLLREDSVVNNVASPTKFAEYLMSGVPAILTHCIGDYSEFTREYDTGFVMDGFNCTPDFIEYIQSASFKRDFYYDHCYKTASDKLSWRYASIELKNIYALSKS